MTPKNLIEKYKDKLSETFQHYPAMSTAAIVAFVALLVFLLTPHNSPQTEVAKVDDDVQVADTLALNIICMPTLESLPLYHAAESGICDSLNLALGIKTEMAQFDVDSIMRRTQRVDGAVFDVNRLKHYRDTHKALPVTESIRLDGGWQLVTAAPLRIREAKQLKKRIVATARYATSSSLLSNILRGAGINYSDAYHAQINDLSLRTSMLDDAQIDASVLPEPYATLAVSRGHRSIWRSDSVSTLVLCFRNQVLKDKRKQKQIETLRQAYNLAVKDLNAHGTHAADSALIKDYQLPQTVIDTLRLPKYRTL